MVKWGTSASLQTTCGESRNIVAAYQSQVAPYGPDVAFAGFLAGICDVLENRSVPGRPALEPQTRRLADALPRPDVRWRFADRIMEAVNAPASPEN